MQGTDKVHSDLPVVRLRPPRPQFRLRYLRRLTTLDLIASDDSSAVTGNEESIGKAHCFDSKPQLASSN